MKEFSRKNLKDWEWEIVNDFPEFFIDKPSPTVQEYINSGRIESDDWINLRYGFEFPPNDAWIKAVRQYLTNTRNLLLLLHKSGEDPEALMYGCIMKEKFGRLAIQNDYDMKSPYRHLYLSIVMSAENQAPNLSKR